MLSQPMGTDGWWMVFGRPRVFRRVNNTACATRDLGVDERPQASHRLRLHWLEQECTVRVVRGGEQLEELFHETDSDRSVGACHVVAGGDPCRAGRGHLRWRARWPGWCWRGCRR